MAISLILCLNGLRKQFFHLVGPPFLAVKLFPSLDGVVVVVVVVVGGGGGGGRWWWWWWSVVVVVVVVA